MNSGIPHETIGLTHFGLEFKDVSTNSIKKFAVEANGDSYLKIFTDDYSLDGEVKTINVIITSIDGLVPQ